MYFLNLTLGQFLILFGSVSVVMLALYLLDRSRRRQVVSTLRFWVAAEQPAVITRRKKIQQPLSLVLQLLSMALLLLAIAQLRLGSREAAPRNHVLILDTSAWMGAPAANPGAQRRTLMDVARQRARAYIHAVPARDRIMLVRADGLATPATAFEPDRRKLEKAIDDSRPGATALNLEEALTFARQLEAQRGRSAGEIVFVGAGRIAQRDTQQTSGIRLNNLRVISVQDKADDCGLRKIGLRRSSSDPDVWEIYVAARNYGAEPRTVTLVLGFGPSSDGKGETRIGSERLVLPADSDREATFEYRTRAAGFLQASLVPHDGFPDDDRAILEVPPQTTFAVTVYSDQPDLLRPVLTANPRVNATFRKPSEYRGSEQTGLAILDRFRPAVRPTVDSIWIDPPSLGSPIPIRARLKNIPFAGWISDQPLGLGLRAKDFRLAAASVFEAAPHDVRIGEAEGGAVIVARPGRPKTVVFGFHPALSPMRYELSTPLLFANILRWMSPEIFRRWDLSAGSVGIVKAALDSDVSTGAVRVIREDGSPIPFTVRDHTLHFFSGRPGTVRVLAGDREYVYSLTLPELWESTWKAPEGARSGVPRFAPVAPGSLDLWQWLALLGGAGLLLEWLLYGRQRRLARLQRAPVAMQKAS